MIIKILGTGCPKCKQLEANAIKAVEQSGINATVEKITEIKDIMNYGVMATPAIVIDETVKAAGKLLSASEIEKLIR